MGTTRHRRENTNTRRLKTHLERKQKLVLILSVSLILGLAVWMLIALLAISILAIVPILFCIYSLVGIGRRTYSKIYLGVVAIMSVVPLVMIATVVTGFIKDGYDAPCHGLMGGASSCVDSSLFTVLLLAWYVLIPYVVLSIIGLFFQIRTSIHVKRK